MDASKREFVRLLALAAAAGMPLATPGAQEAAALYDVPPPFAGTGAVSLLHFTDCHAQLLPIRFREPSVNLGVGTMSGQWPH
ncbi:MAG: thiosulfohydrolase SoxB, partial [Burkholderiaceae bacterium]